MFAAHGRPNNQAAWIFYLFQHEWKGTALHPKKSLFIALLVLVTTSITPALAQQVLKMDPPAGALQTGTSVLVDDGSCPKGQIKKLTRIGPMTREGHRKQECVRYKK